MNYSMMAIGAVIIFCLCMVLAFKPVDPAYKKRVLVIFAIGAVLLLLGRLI